MNIHLDLESCATTDEVIGLIKVPAFAAVAEVNGREIANFEAYLDFTQLEGKQTKRCMKFWNEQPRWLQNLVLGGKQEPYHALRAFKGWVDTITMGETGEVTFIANPPRFDQAIMEMQLLHYGIEIPWNHYQWQCLRTLRRQLGVNKEDVPFLGQVHHPLDDARHQVRLWALCQEKLKGIK